MNNCLLVVQLECLTCSMMDASLPRASPQPSSLVMTAEPSFTMIRLESVKSLLLQAMVLLAPVVKVESGGILAQLLVAKLIMSLPSCFQMMTKAKCAVVILNGQCSSLDSLYCVPQTKKTSGGHMRVGCVLNEWAFE